MGEQTCAQLGFDFGFEVTGCTTTSGAFSSLTKTESRVDCDTSDIGEFELTCLGPDGTPNAATIRTTVDVSVFVHGGNGGRLHSLTKDTSFPSLTPGNGAAISYLEFCVSGT